MANKKQKVNNCTELDPEVKELISKRDLIKAEKLARKKIKEKIPTNYYTIALTLATIGFLKNKEEKKKEAKKYYKKIIREFPNTMHAYLSEARIREENYKPKEALPFYKKAFKKCPTKLNALHIGNIYKQLNKPSLAKKYYLLAEKKRRGFAAHHLKMLFKKK
ncbi:MAG: hypothetical protein GF387_02055 [Candidatus Portnoybacteria bacterium]|nr:hypothetical protein [Candidatus Portnoybacteria bacterium]